ncbi:MAG: hypothetical protein ACI81G_001183, partial [Gammaproteobacteria bacterium]
HTENNFMSIKQFLYYFTLAVVLFACSSESQEETQEMTQNGSMESPDESTDESDDQSSEDTENIFRGSKYLYSQTDVDALGAEGYTRIEGELNIERGNGLDPVTSLVPLSTLKYIGQGFSLNNLSELEQLDGLENLTFIGGYISLKRLDNLADLNNYPISTGQNLGITFSDLPLIRELPNFANYTNVNQVVINRLPNLEQIDGFHNLIECKWLAIEDNAKLESIDGFENLTSSSTQHLLQITGNESLHSITAFTNYEGGEKTTISIGGNNLNNLDFISNLTQVEYFLLDQGINDNYTLLGPFTMLNQVDYIILNDLTISSLEFSFQNLTTLKELHIKSCPILSEIGGFENLSNSPNGESIRLILEGNINLSNICSLSNWLTNNPVLYFNTENNAYNPTLDDILNGDCSN